MNNIEKFLPLGTVCIFKNTKRKSIIVGYLVRTERDNDGVCDYMAYPYPMGLWDNSNILVFNHEDIDSVIFMGYNDAEQKKLNKQMCSISNELENTIEKYKKGEIDVHE